MGYSNNKWRKILTILMIINLCFILFAKFTKVFGAFSEITYDNLSFSVSENLNSHYLLCLISKNGSTYHLEFKITEQPATILYQTNYGYRIRINSAMWNGNTSNSQQPNLQFFNNTTMQLENIGASDKDLGASNYTQNVQVWANYDVRDTSNNIIINETSDFIAPYFQNSTEISNGYPDGVIIKPHSYGFDDTLYFHLLKITNTINDGNQTIYYYSPKVFALNKNTSYYQNWIGADNFDLSYYFVSRSALGLDTNSSYLYVLSNSSDSFTNTYGILQPDVPGGIYDVVDSDTTGVITPQDSTNDKIQNIDDTLNENTVSSDTETNIENSLNFNNQNEGLNNLNGGFFSRLTSMLSNLLGYNLAEDTTVNLPVPNSNKTITLHSKDIYDNVTGAIRLIINAFWVYIFSFYMWRFINKIYIAVSTGNILDTFSSSGEAITNDML